MVTMIMSIQPCNYGLYCFIWLASKQKISFSAQRFGPIWTKNFGHPFVSIWHLLGCGDHIYLWNRKQKIASFASTGWFTVCNIFYQPLRGNKFHLILVINDSFCSCKVTKSTHKNSICVIVLNSEVLENVWWKKMNKCKICIFIIDQKNDFEMHAICSSIETKISDEKIVHGT